MTRGSIRLSSLIARKSFDDWSRSNRAGGNSHQHTVTHTHTKATMTDHPLTLFYYGQISHVIQIYYSITNFQALQLASTYRRGNEAKKKIVLAPLLFLGFGGAKITI